MIKFLLLLFILAPIAHGFELIMVQAVSDSKKTFVTRNGLRQGVIKGMTATFTSENVSILAKAYSVTGNYAQWEIINKEAILPFEKGSIVTYYPATEYLWALAPEEERRKYIKTEIPRTRRSWVFRGSLSRGISESVSDVPASETTRGGFMGEIFYEKDITYGFAWDVGYRYEREVINYNEASFLTARSVLITDLLYYFDQFKEYISGRLYLGAGVGYGLSNTTTIGVEQSGQVGILPTVKIGLSLPFNDTWEFLTDAAFESLQTIEQQEGGNEQTTTQTNLKFGFGLRRYF